jgi:hypothetical protein
MEASSSKNAFERMREAAIFDSIQTRHALDAGECAGSGAGDPRKRDPMIAITALATAWASKAAASLLGSATPKRKSHG